MKQVIDMNPSIVNNTYNSVDVYEDYTERLERFSIQKKSMQRYTPRNCKDIINKGKDKHKFKTIHARNFNEQVIINNKMTI